MSRLANRVAVVVGGGVGIGGAIAQRFAAEGAQVYATGRTAVEGVPGPPSRDGDGVRAIRADAGSLADLERVFARVHADEGRIDVLVVNAGVSEYAPLGGISEDSFDRIFGLNVRSLAFAVQGVVSFMPAGGTIVLVGSIAGAGGTKGYGVYGASKAAVRSFARTWANELAPRGIRVNVVSPGPTDTAMFDAVPAEVREAITARIPLGRLGRPDEVAAAALFLASDDSSFTTGAELCVDGGAAQV